MSPRRIVVTGATGFIGRHVAERLQARGDDVLACGRNPGTLAELAASGLRTHRTDLVGDALDELLAGADGVVHAAALSSPWGRRQDFIDANVTATRRLLDAARGTGVPRIVHLSSPSIYFAARDRIGIGEDFIPPRRWITAYAESKWLAEQAVHAAADAHMQAVVLRPRAVFGHGDRAIFPRLIARAQRGRFPLVNGGQAMIDVTCVSNVVQAVERALDTPMTATVETFNISNSEPMPVRMLLDTLFSALDLPVRYWSLPRGPAMRLAGAVETIASVLPGNPEPPVSRYMLGVLAYSQTLDIEAARTRLGYVPRETVREGIAAFARDWKRHAAP